MSYSNTASILCNHQPRELLFWKEGPDNVILERVVNFQGLIKDVQEKLYKSSLCINHISRDLTPLHKST